MIKMDEKTKLLKLKSEVKAAVQKLENAINHLRDYQELLQNKMDVMEIDMLEKTLTEKKTKLGLE